MEVRISNIIETLKRLPTPVQVGENRNVEILKETWEDDAFHLTKNTGQATLEVITVKARQYRRGSDSWLEWVLDV